MNENMDRIKVSVVIPCRNEEKYIGKCLDSIICQSYGMENIEVMVADGCSEDNTQNIVKEYENRYPQIKLLINNKKAAPYAMNLGIKNSTGQVIIIFGAHAYMDKDYVSICVKKLEDKEIDCVGGRIENISESQSAKAISLAMSSPFGVGNALFRYSDTEELVDTVAFGAYKRETFDKIGLFDEQFIRNQDDELNFRIIKSGGKILLCPDIISYYYTRGSYKKLWRQYFQYGFWKVRVIQKHKRPASIRHIIPMLFVLGLIFGGILSFFFSFIRYIYFAVVSIYAASSIYFSYKITDGDFKYLFKVVLSFIILHISYGLGFIDGIITFYITKNYDKINKNTKTSR